MSAYEEFLRAKVCVAERDGFDVEDADCNPALKDHTRLMVRWALSGGRRAIFASFGLHKTAAQLEIMRLIGIHRPCLRMIVLPLGVRQEFRRDAAERFTGAYALKIKFIRTTAEIEGEDTIYLTNYESVREGKIDVSLFGAVSLDEAAILRGFGGTKTFREFMALFAGDRKTLNQRTKSAGVNFRFVATATPSPNDYIELLAYSAFLGIMDVSAAKTRFFKRDSTKADTLTIHAHKQNEFWLWVASWALFVTQPSDLGFSDEGYALPALVVRWHEVGSVSDPGTERNGQQRMFANAAIGVQESAREKRTSLPLRVARTIELVRDEQTATRTRTHTRTRTQCETPEDAGVPQLSAGISAGSLPCAEAEEWHSTASNPGEKGIHGRVPEGEQANSASETTCAGSAETLRTDTATFSSVVGDAGPRVSDMPSAAGKAGGGSHPRYETSTGTALPQLQCSAGFARGQHGQLGARARLPSNKAASSCEQVIVWCDLNDEQRAIELALDAQGITYSSLYGSQPIDEREKLLEDWKDRRTTVFLSKTSMYGAGVNLQQCHRMVYAGVHFKFNEVIQGVHRINRFGQQHACHVDFVYTEAERDIRHKLEKKWTQHNEQRAIMTGIIKEYGLSESAMALSLTRALGVERCEVSGKNYRLVHNDSILETRSMPDNSVDLILTSIPFSTQYEYSPNYADLGHTDNNAHFFAHMDFLTPELLRVLKPGRIAAIHVKDRIVPMGMTGLGCQVAYRFHSKVGDHYEKHGFAYLGMKTIVTDVVRENNQTYRLGWTEQCKDGTKMGVGMPEYLLLFRKPPTDTSNAYADAPVIKQKKAYTIRHSDECIAHEGEECICTAVREWYNPSGYSRARWQTDAHGFMRSAGQRLMTPEELKSLPHDTIFQMFKRHSLESVYDFEHHVKIGEALEADGRLPVTFMLLQPQSWSDEVWTDITRMLTLNGAQSAKGKEMHLCPMQFDLADRVIEQMTQPGELVYDPFGGLATVPYRAILKGRRGLACELAKSYFLDGATYCEMAEREMATPTLFDTLSEEAA